MKDNGEILAVAGEKPVGTSIKRVNRLGARGIVALISVICMCLLALAGAFGWLSQNVNGVYADEYYVAESEGGADEAAVRKTAINSSWQFVDNVPVLQNLPVGVEINYSVQGNDGVAVARNDVAANQRYSVTATLSADSAKSYYFAETGTSSVSMFFVYANDTTAADGDSLDDVFPFWSILIIGLAVLGFIVACGKIIANIHDNVKDRKEQKNAAKTNAFGGITLLAFLGLDVKVWMILAFAAVALFFIGVIVMLLTWRHHVHPMVAQGATTHIHVHNNYNYTAGLIADAEEEEVVEPEIKRRRNPTNFRVRLKASSDKCKEFYVQLKNFICGYRDVTFRMRGTVEKILYQDQVLACIGTTKRSLKLYLALNPADYDPEVYHHKDVSDKKRYELVPMLVRIGSGRALTRAKGLIGIILERYSIEPKTRYTERNLQLLAYTLGRNALVKDKRAEMLRMSIHVHDADTLSVEDAERFIETRKRAPLEERRNYAVINLDTLDSKFLDGQRVTLDKLKKKELVPADCNVLRITAGTRLTKPLYVVADLFSLDAAKMIVLTGGRAVRLVEEPNEK